MRLAWAILIAALVPASPGTAARVTRDTLPNGLRVIVGPSWSTDLVAIELLLDLSALDEAPDQSGIRYLIQRLLLRGTDEQSGDEMGRRLSRVGGVADTSVGLDYVEFYAVAPADGFELALDLLAEAVRRPAFLPEEIPRQKAAAAEAIAAARQDPFQQTYLAFREAIYGDHPYGRLTLGDPECIDSITRDDLRSFHAQHYVPGKTVLAICGAVGEARAMRAARRALGDWRARKAPPRPALAVEPLSSSHVVAREMPARSAHVVLGFPAPPALENGYFAIQTIDSLLGGGAGARLPKRLRDERGLVYNISSFYPTLAAGSHFGVYASVEPRQVETLKNAVLEVLRDLCGEEVSEEELAQAKRYLLGSYALSHQRLKDQAYALAWYEVLGLGSGFEEQYKASVQAVTTWEVRAAAQRLLRRFAVAVTMPMD